MKLCVIPGDGIGPEVVTAALRVLQVLVPEIELDEQEAGWATFQQSGHALPDATVIAAQNADAIFFGAVGSPSHPIPGYRSPIVALRRKLDLYANIRPIHAIRNNTSDIDFVVVRENTEGLYVGRERLEDEGNTAIAERVITRRGSERIITRAFELARERARSRDQNPKHPARLPKVTIVHKANVLRTTDGLFREVALYISKKYPEIAVEELLVDVGAMRVAQSPDRFDVLVTTNLYGDILSDVAAIHVGGLGMASSANFGEDRALFEPVHGAAPDITGRGIANPLAALGCVALMLEWAEQQGLLTGQRSHILRSLLDQVIQIGPHTPDLGGNATTNEIIEAVLQGLRNTSDDLY